MNIIKLLTLASAFKDVTSEVKKAGLEKRPWYLQRTVIGAIIAVGSAALAAYTGIQLEDPIIEQLTENMTTLITVGATVYGAVLSIYGMAQKVIKAKNEH